METQTIDLRIDGQKKTARFVDIMYIIKSKFEHVMNISDMELALYKDANGNYYVVQTINLDF